MRHIISRNVMISHWKIEKSLTLRLTNGISTSVRIWIRSEHGIIVYTLGH